MTYGEPTSQRELTEAKAYSRSRLAMKRAEARRAAGDPHYQLDARPTVAPQQCSDAEAMLSEVAALIASWRAGHIKSLSVIARLDRMFPGSPSA